MLRFVVFIALFAVVVYAGFWLLDRRKGGGGGKKAAKPIPRGPVGPDDDEDFLRELERKRRHSKDAEKNGKPKDVEPKNGQPKNGQPKNVQPKQTPPKSPPPKDPQAKDDQPDAQPEPQPKPQPTEGKPTDGEATSKLTRACGPPRSARERRRSAGSRCRRRS